MQKIIVRALSSRKSDVLSNLVRGYNYLFLDEAQDIPDIGKNLKLLPIFRKLLTGTTNLRQVLSKDFRKRLSGILTP